MSTRIAVSVPERPVLIWWQYRAWARRAPRGPRQG
jgi:hypothetical protein